MDSDWDSEEETELFSSSLHIPINAEAKKAYDQWVEKECNDGWWDKKEIETIETPTQNNPFHSDIVKELMATEEGKNVLEDYYNKEQESLSRRLRIDR